MHQQLDRVDLANATRVRERHSAPEATTLGHEGPWCSGGKLLRFTPAVHWTDRLAGFGKGWIGPVDLDLGKQGHDLPTGQLVPQP
jgi:hypothetical protein